MPDLVLDTDPGVDDALAILYLAAQPDTRIVAVGSAIGNMPADASAANALRVLELAGLTGVPVAVGASRPLNGLPWTADAEVVHGADGLGGHAGPPPAGRPVRESAAEQLVRLARQRPGELTLLAMAPLTNVALALRLEPELPRLLREVVWMGGAVDVPGNVSIKAEANAWNDPEAAEQVLAAGFSLRMVPLDVTEHAWADPGWLGALRDRGGDLARTAADWLAVYVDYYCSIPGDPRGPGCALHDPLAVAIALDPELADYEEHQVVVELAGHARGATWVDRRLEVMPGSELPARRPVRVALKADGAAMLDRLHRALGVV
ncbi:nucleoside hydrolase [Pseudonocardiaceae bacterium YIM PH 21723]|nr:nucleoside hydrolase [Pseudonocardiaceae bacterium YIM PH 21723]